MTELCDLATYLNELGKKYSSMGYEKYVLTSFEDYSLYQQNSGFLNGKNVITFSDFGGRLLALRSDATLSIVSHTNLAEGETKKYFYDCKVYRPEARSKRFKEIGQTGIEILGVIDDAALAEIFLLIDATLSAFPAGYAVEISHMGIIDAIYNAFGADGGEVIKLLESKNFHDFSCLAKSKNFTDGQIEYFVAALNACGPLEEGLKVLKDSPLNDGAAKAIDELERLNKTLQKFKMAGKVFLNLSVVNSADYYNGIIFNAYLDGVAGCVLSGGRYDKLVKRLGKNYCAVGFALYLGEVAKFFGGKETGVDLLIIYTDKTQQEALELANSARAQNLSVRIDRSIPPSLKYGSMKYL